jgi:AraC-like DNA-binding protein
VKTVEEFAKLGGYSQTTFRRIFDNVFHEPVYEWMLSRRKEEIIYELQNTRLWMPLHVSVAVLV